ncbi:LytR/AlgR family response regulator transcription factor [Spirosoma pulveris]
MKPIQRNKGLLALPGYRTPQPVAQICWLEGQGNYTRIHLSGQKTPLLVSRTLKQFDEQLPEFLRANRGALINPAYVGAITWINSRNMTLLLLDGPPIRAARHRIEEMATKLAAYSELSRLPSVFNRVGAWSSRGGSPGKMESMAKANWMSAGSGKRVLTKVRQ